MSILHSTRFLLLLQKQLKKAKLWCGIGSPIGAAGPFAGEQSPEDRGKKTKGGDDDHGPPGVKWRT